MGSDTLRDYSVRRVLYRATGVLEMRPNAAEKSFIRHLKKKYRPTIQAHRKDCVRLIELDKFSEMLNDPGFKWFDENTKQGESKTE